MYHVGVRPSHKTGFAQWLGMSEYPRLWRGLVGAWDMSLGQTGTKVLDLSGNGNTGMITGAVWRPGKFGPCLDFDDSGDDIAISYTPGDIFYASLWVKPDKITGTDNLILGWSGSISESMQIYNGRWDFWSSNAAFDIYPASPVPVVGKWHHLVFGFEVNVAAHLYVDGVLAGSDTAITSPVRDRITIGGISGTATATMDGQIDHIMIFDRTPSASEIALYYQLRKRMG